MRLSLYLKGGGENKDGGEGGRGVGQPVFKKQGGKEKVEGE
jgi:hypothetical protein